MMIAVRASGFIAWSRTSAARSVCRSPKSETQKPMRAVTKPVTTQAESRPKRPSWPYCSQTLWCSGCALANSVVAKAVLSTVSRANTRRRRLAALSQAIGGSAGPSASEGVRGGSTRLAVLNSAVPMLFQKPRQGRGTMEPRLIGGAVTALGWRSSRSRARGAWGTAFTRVTADVSMFHSRCRCGVADKRAARQAASRPRVRRARSRARRAWRGWDRQGFRAPGRWHWQ